MLVSRFSLSVLPLLFVSSNCNAAKVPGSLSPEESLRYINDEPGFRSILDSEGIPVRLNLGRNFIEYMDVDSEFRGQVLALLHNNRDRVWSDVAELSLFGPAEVLDMNDLTGLVNLRKLTLTGSEVANLDALGGLTSLEELWLEEAGIQDVSGLVQSKSLRRLTVFFTKVQSISLLGRLERLDSLHLFNTGIVDMNELSNCRPLTQLHLADENVRNVRALAELTNLQTLFLRTQDGVLDINELTGCVNLTDLELIAAGFQNVHALGQLNYLQRLDLNGRAYILDAIHGWQPQPLRPVVISHAQIATTLPENEADRICCICLECISSESQLGDCLITCDGKQFNHRNCLVRCNGTCPSCRAPLGVLPESSLNTSFKWNPLPGRSSPSNVTGNLVYYASRFIASMNLP